MPIGTGYAGAFLVTVLLWFLPDMPGLTLAETVAVYVFLLFVYMATFEVFVVRVHLQPGTGLVRNNGLWRSPRHRSALGPKLLGVTTCIGLALLFYFTADLYEADFYAPFFEILERHGLLIAVCIFLNTSLVHFLMRRPEDGYWAVGRFVLSLGRERESDLLRETFLALAIKTFFLPLMFCYLVYDWEYLRAFDIGGIETFQVFFGFAYRFSFFFDLSFVVVGYAFALRILNSHIRWSEPTLAGWLVCILCYMPFWQLLSREYFNYFDGGPVWGAWLADYPLLYGIWGSAILLLLVIYAISTAHFGLRFSNLTYRGVACHGTFAWSKHPQYISKNLSWWLIDIPFIGADFATGLGNSLALLGVNFIYYLRAKYEERCLSRAPSYRRYKDHIDQNGLLARIVRLAGFQK